MRPQNELALIVAYYLSRMDKGGYFLLGYKTFSEAIKSISDILDVKKNTIKNMRDEFDPYHKNSRIGWKRELRGSRLKVLRAFQESDEETILEIVKEILYNKEFKDTDEYYDIHALFSDKKNSLRKSIFILRGPTGRNAENIFLDNFNNNKLPFEGKIIDCRDLGCGYDFEIQVNEKKYFIEVKGSAMGTGGILFTNKEWKTALKYNEDYYLAIVSNISQDPKIHLIQNPALKLNAKRSVYTTIQVTWSVNEKDLKPLMIRNK